MLVSFDLKFAGDILVFMAGGVEASWKIVLSSDERPGWFEPGQQDHPRALGLGG